MVEAVNKHVDPRFVDLGSFRDQAIVRVSVSDVDEPPLFQPAEGATMEVQEDAKVGALVGIVVARDPDVKNKAVRYGENQEDSTVVFNDEVVIGKESLYFNNVKMYLMVGADWILLVLKVKPMAVI